MEAWKKIICKAFQDAVVDVLVQKTLSSIKKTNPKTVLLSGGVATNKELRKQLKQKLTKKHPEIEFSYPDFQFCGDNAAMIAVAGLARFKKIANNKEALKKIKSNWKDLEADANLKLF
jgi:N6-L-threonylcarbamoyladenine synthase